MPRRDLSHLFWDESSLQGAVFKITNESNTSMAIVVPPHPPYSYRFKVIALTKETSGRRKGMWRENFFTLGHLTFEEARQKAIEVIKYKQNEMGLGFRHFMAKGFSRGPPEGWREYMEER